jgi:hypothetical protein
MSDAKFIPGLFFKPPNDGAPEFIISKGSIKIADLIQFLQRQEGEWVNFDLKRSREGKPYAAIDDWKPQGGAGATRGGPPTRNAPRPTQRPVNATAPSTGGFDDFESDDIPFISNRSHF